MQLATTWLFNGLAEKKHGIALPGNKSFPFMERINALNLEATPGAKDKILVRGPLKPPGKHDETEDEYKGTGTSKGAKTKKTVASCNVFTEGERAITPGSHLRMRNMYVVIC